MPYLQVIFKCYAIFFCGLPRHPHIPEDFLTFKTKVSGNFCPLLSLQHGPFSCRLFCFGSAFPMTVPWHLCSQFRTQYSRGITKSTYLLSWFTYVINFVKLTDLFTIYFNILSFHLFIHLTSLFILCWSTHLFINLSTIFFFLSCRIFLYPILQFYFILSCWFLVFELFDRGIFFHGLTYTCLFTCTLSGSNSQDNRSSNSVVDSFGLFSKSIETASATVGLLAHL